MVLVIEAGGLIKQWRLRASRLWLDLETQRLERGYYHGRAFVGSRRSSPSGGPVGTGSFPENKLAFGPVVTSVAW